MTGGAGLGRPPEPWLSRKDWAGRLIEDENRNSGVYLLFFAVFWNAISWGITVAIWAGSKDRGFEHYFILLFPLVGGVVLVAAIHGLLYRRRPSRCDALGKEHQDQGGDALGGPAYDSGGDSVRSWCGDPHCHRHSPRCAAHRRTDSGRSRAVAAGSEIGSARGGLRRVVRGAGLPYYGERDAAHP